MSPSNEASQLQYQDRVVGSPTLFRESLGLASNVWVYCVVLLFDVSGCCMLGSIYELVSTVLSFAIGT